METSRTPIYSSPTNDLQLRPFSAELFDSRNFDRLWTEDAEFRAFARQVYGYLDTMKAGKMLRLDRYSGQKLEWIILTAVAFIDEGVHAIDYCFNNEFTAILHLRVDADIIEGCRVAKYGIIEIGDHRL